MATTDTLIGTLFDERYRILRKLGSGGMANVYLAEDEDLGRRVAIKILNERYASDDAFTERFRREAKSAASLSHPNIVSIYDRGESEGRPYIAMEVIEGRSLKELIVAKGPLPIAVAIEYAKQILAALRFAHRHGIIHRDIKPHNILLGADNRLFVTDFGIARSGPSQMTEVGSIMGTAQYLSPEQARGAPVTAASDLYSAGVVLYEMLTGKTPFTGETPIEIAMKHLNEIPRPPSDLRSEVPPELDQIVLRSLAKDPHERYEAAEEFSADLDRVEAGLPVAPETAAAATMVLAGVLPEGATQVISPDDGTRILPPPPAQARRPPTYPPDYGYHPPPKKRRWVPWLLALLFLAAAVAAAWYLYSRIQDELDSSKPVTVPLVVGLLEDEARGKLEEIGFAVEVKRAADPKQPEGRVSAQIPENGTRLPKGETVTIVVSTGVAKTTVPDLLGMSYEDAVDALATAGLKAKRVERFSDKPAGTVISQDPKPETQVVEGSTVDVRVSKGEELATVPDVLFQDQASAEAELKAAGFKVSVTEAPSDDVEAGLVSEQAPDPGAEASKGSTVGIVVSTGPDSTTVPDVTGQDEESATTTLEDQGFKVKVTEQDTTDPTQDGIVLDQNPSGGVKAEPGSQVRITVGRLITPRGKGRDKNKGPHG
jgi:beta-lactam-binding protein with PASTA domain/predicted Ser/Thr protein kinase